MSSSRSRRLVTFVSAAALFGGAGGAGVAAIVGDPSTTRTITVTQRAASSSSSSTLAPETVADVTTALSAADIYDRSEDAVVYISARSAQGEGTGSGFVVSSDGYIVTNAHVIDGAQTVEVKIGDRDEVRARVVGVDESTDIALLDVDATGLETLSLGDSDDVQVGDATYAIGNPFGLDRTLTTGVVSALHREIESPNGYAINDVVQTDAALNPGNSGGPLLDGSGDVIGVNSQIETSGTSNANAGVGFAVPSNTVKRVVEQLRTDGRATHAYLGVATAETDEGVVVETVRTNGPAAQAGLRRGDRITQLDGTAVEDAGDIGATVNAHRPGDKLTAQVVRDGERLEVDVELGTRPS